MTTPSPSDKCLYPVTENTTVDKFRHIYTLSPAYMKLESCLSLQPFWCSFEVTFHLLCHWEMGGCYCAVAHFGSNTFPITIVIQVFNPPMFLLHELLLPVPLQIGLTCCQSDTACILQCLNPFVHFYIFLLTLNTTCIGQTQPYCSDYKGWAVIEFLIVFSINQKHYALKINLCCCPNSKQLNNTTSVMSHSVIYLQH